MVEGGGSVHTQLLADDLVDELQLVVAPFFAGEPAARRRGPAAHALSDRYIDEAPSP
jgi:riboflavin biosynthesis pyrimidine reductase